MSGDRGRVSQVDRGTYELLPAAANERRFRVAGAGLRGCLVLTAADAQANSWQVRLLVDPEDC